LRTRDENKEAAIRKKAMELIVKHGFDGLSMQKLAQAARVSPATIYIYFKNREDLLNQVFKSVHHTFTDTALEGFDPDMSFKEGLWLQWQNRFRFITKYPVHYRFFEQFRHSPLIHHNDVKLTEFKENMRAFIMNAMKKGEIKQLEPEIYWSLAYGPFYSLIRFHLQQKNLMNLDFKLTQAKMRTTFEQVLRSFQP
jgi:TetR/AcrR family transcriptional repressor of multidrug resistance operon